MILPERLNVYLDSLQSKNGTFLEELEEEAIAEGVPVIRKQMQGFLKTILPIRRPKRILEVGTGSGFSALLMAENTEKSCRITTIENNKERIAAAKKNIARDQMQDRIELLSGNAEDLLPLMKERFDLIFMDAAKGQYPHLLADVLRLLDENGVLITDNVLLDGEILESHYVVKRRNRTIQKRMREYLYELTHTSGLETSVLPIGDGAALSVKCENKAEE